MQDLARRAEVLPATYRSGRIGRLPITLGGLFLSICLSGAEPRPPDWLTLRQVGTDSRGAVTLEAVVSTDVKGTVELIVSSGGATFQDGKTRKTLQRVDAATRKQRIHVDTAGGRHRELTVTLRILGDDGREQMRIDRKASFNAPAARPTGSARVPWVQTRPDGSKIVEYISKDEAQRRGITPGAPSVQRTPARAPAIGDDDPPPETTEE